MIRDSTAARVGPVSFRGTIGRTGRAGRCRAPGNAILACAAVWKTNRDGSDPGLETPVGRRNDVVMVSGPPIPGMCPAAVYGGRVAWNRVPVPGKIESVVTRDIWHLESCHRAAGLCRICIPA